ncbi:hypothetical protein ACWKSP_26645 [Micromonosporaceae bacterium Da 78-11]
MEYGDRRRLINNMFDRETLPTWRAVAAWQWGTPCVDEHLAEIAADPILTTHLIASVALAITPDHAYNRATQLGFSHAGAGAVFAELRRSGSLVESRLIVERMSGEARLDAVHQCVRHLNSGLLALQLDTEAHFLR